jgi:hypothetical protein
MLTSEGVVREEVGVDGVVNNDFGLAKRPQNAE